MKSNSETENKAHLAWENGKLKLAFKLFNKGVQEGCNGCLLNLGYFYDEGIGTQSDKKMAMYWYKKAYRLGNGAAANNIAMLYREVGDHRKTFQWLQRAAKLQDGDAEVELAKLCVTGKGVRKSLERAKSHLKNALAATSISEYAYEEAENMLAELNGLAS